MIQVFRWPNQGLHRDRFLVVVHSAVWHTLDWLLVYAAVIPFVNVMTFDPHAIINTFGEVNVFSGTARKAPGDDDNPELAYKIALNRAIRKALASLGLSEVWDETYHARRKPHRVYCMRRDQDSLVVSSSRSVLMSLPGRCDGIAPLCVLPRIVAHIVAQRAAIDLKLGFRHNLTLHYGKTNCVDGRNGWTMVHSWPKSTGEGEPDDFGTIEQVFLDDQAAAEGFTAKAKQLLRIE